MPLPLTLSCFSKIQIGFTFLVPAHPRSPRQRAVKRVCVYAGVDATVEGGGGGERDAEQHDEDDDAVRASRRCAVPLLDAVHKRCHIGPRVRDDHVQRVVYDRGATTYRHTDQSVPLPAWGFIFVF